MAMRFVYNSTDLGATAVRLGQVPGFITDTELGSVGMMGLPIDDVAGTLSLVGLQSFHVDESAGPVGQQRLWTGYTAERVYRRGESDSLIVGGERVIDLTLWELNTIWSWRLFPPTDSAANRPSETDVARMQWLLTTSYLKPTVTDYGFVNTSGGVTLDAADYRGQSALSLMADCANASGKNFFAYYDESHNGVGVYYDFDYGTNYTCTLKLSNVLSDYDGTTTFMVEPDATLEVDPSRVYSGVQVPYSGTGSPQYVTNSSTASTFVARDTTAPNLNAKTAGAAQALGVRYLESIATEDQKLTCRVKLPPNKVTLLRSGMRIQFKSSFMPGLTSFTYCRIVHLEAKQDEMTDQLYDVALELYPPIQPVVPSCAYTATPYAFYPPLNSGTTDAQGVQYYAKPGLTQPSVPTPGYAGNWNFPAFGSGGTPDYAWANTNTWRVIVVGPGKLTIHTALYLGGTGSYTVTNFVTLATYTGTAGVDLTISIPDIASCLNIFDMSATFNIGAYGVTWAAP